jgi:hypothetical protein
MPLPAPLPMPLLRQLTVRWLRPLLMLRLPMLPLRPLRLKNRRSNQFDYCFEPSGS